MSSIYDTLGADEELPAVLAINEAVGRLYDGEVAGQWGTLVSWALGGPDPLDRVRAYRARDHWHYVGYGLSDLDEDSFPDSPLSGYGFELTFRLRGDEDEPPIWPAHFLQSLARYVWNARTALRPGEWFHFDASWRDKYALPGAIFVADPEVPAITTDYGQVTFVQVVGVTDAEIDRIRADTKTWQAVHDARRAADPRLVTTR